MLISNDNDEVPGAFWGHSSAVFAGLSPKKWPDCCPQPCDGENNDDNFHNHNDDGIGDDGNSDNDDDNQLWRQWQQILIILIDSL